MKMGGFFIGTEAVVLNAATLACDPCGLFTSTFFCYAVNRMIESARSWCVGSGKGAFVRYGLAILTMGFFLFTLNAQTANETTLVGKWKLNTDKSHYKGPHKPIYQATMVISEATASHFKWQKSWGVVVESGRVLWEDDRYDGAIDGKPHDLRVAGERYKLSFDDRNGVLEGTETSPQTSTHHRITVSEDGNTITWDSSSTYPGGTASGTSIWERVPDKKGK
jgi:hypothetical protein